MANLKEQEAMIGVIYRPEVEPFPTQVRKFVFNKDTGAFMGRTASSWAKICIFYLIFYIGLASLFSLLMFILYYTLDPRIPKYQLDSSLIGTNPGLGFRPMPNDSNSLSTLIWYKGTSKKDFEYWTNSLTEFLESYRVLGDTAGRGANIANCDFARGRPDGKVCSVNVKNLMPCVPENNFNYHLQGPCIFLKLNRIFGWKPNIYEPNELPDNMPSDLKQDIQSLVKENEYQKNTIWVSCEGESPADVEHVGPISYKPYPGFPAYFFPYENNEGYLSPIVAVLFEKPRTGILINIECKAWAKNIIHDRKDRLGSVHFELMID
uniref:Putative sodium/potassium-transporting atpase subunit beta-2-like isoform x2 n=1 Tax=Panstrongylus megistus TaxID=65343 RepID=A0A069DSJ3_9HEMI